MSETVGKVAVDLQTDAEPFAADGRTGCRCTAVKANGERCKARPLAGSELCALHTPGLASAIGRRGGLGRRREPKPTPRTRPAWTPPPADPDVPPIVLPDTPLESAEQIAQVRAAAIAAVAAGQMDPRVGTALSTMLEHQRKAIETTVLERRLAAIEAAGGSK